MIQATRLSGLCGSTAAAALLVFSAGAATAQASSAASAEQLSEVVVTGSRIPRSDTTTSAPVTVLTPENLEERGIFNLGLLLNQVTSNVPQLPVGQGQGFPGGDAKTSPNLFGLGSGRTLTLVNGRRMVATSSGLGDRTVDSGIIPAGLVKRVDIVQGGGAAVYGSDAIAGVVNYVLQDHFEGLTVDGQYGEGRGGSYPSRQLRATAGRNFADGRGNIAADLSWSKTDPLLESQRARTANGMSSITNPANTSTTDGIAPTAYIFNGRIWTYNPYGVIWATPNNAVGGLLKLNGSPLQWSPDGQSVIPYDTGTIIGTNTTAIGGQGLDRRALSTLAAGLQRINFSALGHYDITDHVKFSSEVLYSKEESVDPYGTQQVFRTVGNSGASGPISFNKNNPFLTPGAIATLSAASPSFAAGGNLSMTRFMDILPSRDRHTETEVYRLEAGFDGDFKAFERDFTWSVSGSHAASDYTVSTWAPYLAHMNNAVNNPVKNGAGQIVCGINADANPANDDPACVALNPFGQGNESAAARAYVSALTGSTAHNFQDDFLAVIGGDVIKLPAGLLKFSAAYEHRYEKTEFRPFAADIAGITTTGTPPIARDAGYHTNEYSAEGLLPIVGGDFTLPLVKAFTLNGSYRYVDHSIAGINKVWGYGGNWDTGLFGISFRASKSKNFRAPSLDQLFAPTSTASGQPLGSDPCDADRINGGNNPANRLKNCQALFAAHPEYGSLAGFQDPAENTGIVSITSGGNTALKNEISNTTTWGVVFQPPQIPGLTFTVDRVEVNLTDGLVAFSPASFAALCYDEGSADACSTFTRNASGYITQGRSTTFNAGRVVWNGEIYNLSYRFQLGALWDKDLGSLELATEVTHNTKQGTATTTPILARTDGTTTTPDFRTRFDVRYSKGPLKIFYSAYRLSEAKSGFTDTIETTPVPIIASNTTHSISTQYTFRNYTLRGGVNNLTDTMPSFPTRGYGDIMGRQWYIGLRAKY